MKKLRVLLLNMLVLFNVTAQTVSLKVSYIDFNKIKANIETFVNNEIGKWQQQGKFESSEDFLNRVTDSNRQQNINELTTIRINSIATDVIKLSIENADYDPDNEVYKIVFVGLPSIYIKVAKHANEAASFEKNLSKLSLSNPSYTLTNQGFALLGLNIFNPSNEKMYKYNYQDNLTFGNNRIEVKYDPVTVNIGDYKRNVIERDNPLILNKQLLVDNIIPNLGIDRPDAFAVIIGNSNYEKTVAVKYAARDAQIMKQYFINVLGFREGNILYKENATKGYFEEIFGSQNDFKGKLNNIIVKGKSDVFVYYSGHGAPGLRDKKGYVVPVESDPLYVELTGYSQELLINNLSKIQAKSVTLIFDACFSGADVLDNVSSIFPKVSEPIYNIENGVLLGASKANQVSTWYDDMQHGLFTYFFLKGLQDMKKCDKNNDGTLTFQELYEYISDNNEGVPYWARKLHNVEQNPTIQGNSNNHILVKY